MCKLLKLFTRTVLLCTFLMFETGNCSKLKELQGMVNILETRFKHLESRFVDSEIELRTSIDSILASKKNLESDTDKHLNEETITELAGQVDETVNLDLTVKKSVEMIRNDLEEEMQSLRSQINILKEEISEMKNDQIETFKGMKEDIRIWSKGIETSISEKERRVNETCEYSQRSMLNRLEFLEAAFSDHQVAMNKTREYMQRVVNDLNKDISEERALMQTSSEKLLEQVNKVLSIFSENIGSVPFAEEAESEGLDFSCDSESWQKFRGHCYKYFHELYSWGEIKWACDKASKGAYPVEIENAEENVFVYETSKKMADPTYWWIGGNDRYGEGDWIWDHSKIRLNETFTAWAEGEPNNSYGHEDCLELDGLRNGQWNDNNCSNRKKYICEKDGVTTDDESDTR